MLWYQSIPIWFQKIFGRYTWRIPNQDKTVYLTFDDGPHPEITPWVLQQLANYNYKATFFCVGDNVRKFPETYQSILSSQHKTGNHTMHHIKGWKSTLDHYTDNVADCAKLVDSNLFRPPYGRITRPQTSILRKKYKIIMWSLLALDFEKKLNTTKALEGLKKKTKPGSIIVFHDSVKAEKNLKTMLPLYLQFLNQNGFNCKVI
ncbi:MAG: polysaccharide deacetylase family protein [bacterium]|nr:polysaccharide deacetylase family protein [bacterium]